MRNAYELTERLLKVMYCSPGVINNSSFCKEPSSAEYLLVFFPNRHPSYEDGLPYFDVAVVTLDSPADVTGYYVRTICLPNSSPFIGAGGTQVRYLKNVEDEESLKQLGHVFLFSFQTCR